MGARIRVATNIRVIRMRKGISQEKLAELAGLHRTYISSVERGERNISIDSIEKIAVSLGIDIKELMALNETTY